MRNNEGYRLGTASFNNSPIIVIESESDPEIPPKKKKATGEPSSEESKANSTEPSFKGPLIDQDQQEPSCSLAEMPQRKPASPSTMHSKGASPQAKRSSSSQGEQSRSSPTHTDQSPDSCEEGTSNGSSVICHYCSSREQRSAVKTCLVCGASMCPEHLQAHLESPVFQSHPLVPAVEDVSPWRCQEHQEMNRIYCHPCGMCVCTVCTVIGSHKDHACVSIREAEKELRVSRTRKKASHEAPVIKSISPICTLQ